MGLVLDGVHNGILVIDIKLKSKRDYMLPETTDVLIEIKCPYERISKSDNKLYKCNSLCVKVTAGSAGEARCRKCRLNFLFRAEADAQPTTGVRIQPIN